MRIRNKWRADKPRSLEENATASAYMVWQLGLHFAKHLHEQEFDYESDWQRVSVIKEYLIFMSHVVDRLAYTLLAENERQSFMAVLVEQVARHYQRNTEEVYGPGNYKSGFLTETNDRFMEYAGCDFENTEPGYTARRILGHAIQDILGMSQTNRWVIQQVIDIDAPDAASQVTEGVTALLNA